MPTDAVDSRFDPRFQRGFDPDRHEVTLVATISEPPEAVAPPPTATPPADGTAADEDESDDPPMIARRRDPFPPAILALAALLLASGGWLAYRSAELSILSWSRPYQDEDAWILSVGTALAPGLFGAGIAALVAWLALHALRPRT